MTISNETPEAGFLNVMSFISFLNENIMTVKNIYHMQIWCVYITYLYFI